MNREEVLEEVKRRLSLLDKVRKSFYVYEHLCKHYQNHPADFINDWGMTFDPRLLEVGQDPIVPFKLFPHQREMIEKIYSNWKNQKPLIIEKSRDVGASWVCVCLAVTMCLFNPGMVIGFGSRKEEYIDRTNSPKTLFYKGRFFIKNLPEEFKFGWEEKTSPYMRINFMHNNSYITGEAGVNIGRGDRASIYFVDEAAYLSAPQLVEASLSQTTNCRIDVSTPNGANNPFAIKRFSGKCDVFTFSWMDDPRKDRAWYEKKKQELDPVTFAQEVDISYTASETGLLLDRVVVDSLVGAADTLGIKLSDKKFCGWDIADEGNDKLALACIRDIELEKIHSWSGKNSELFTSTKKAIMLAEEYDASYLYYDADGFGASVKGNVKQIKHRVKIVPYKGSSSVIRPNKKEHGATPNKDFFANRKSQSWWEFRRRALITYEAIAGSRDDYDKADILSISPNIDSTTLRNELASVKYLFKDNGKLIIQKHSSSGKSPDQADAWVLAVASSDSRSYDLKKMTTF